MPGGCHRTVLLVWDKRSEAGTSLSSCRGRASLSPSLAAS